MRGRLQKIDGSSPGRSGPSYGICPWSPVAGAGIDTKVKQKLGQDRTLARPYILLNGCCVLPSHLDSHGGVLIDVLDQENVRNPEPLQYRPQA